MHATLKQLHDIGLVPVVKVADAADAVPLARALAAGGLPAAEVTFRTPAAANAIRAISQEVPEVVVGAGTVLTPEQADAAVAAGASFVVSPGFNPKVVDHCLERGILVMPGVSDASGVESCLERGLRVVKFFPAEAAGGLPYLKALSGPYQDVLFMPTGGVNPTNLTSYTTWDRVLACGGTWMAAGVLIAQGRWDEVERLARDAVADLLGFRLAHVGLNCPDEREAARVAQAFCSLFGLAYRDGESVFCGDAVEVLKRPYLGEKGHIAISTIDIERAVAHLSRRGVAFRGDSEKRLPDGRLNAIYLAEEIGGFAVHLVRRDR